MDVSSLLLDLKKRSDALGFDSFGVVNASARPDLEGKLNHVLDNKWHADMEWMHTTKQRRASPKALWPEVKSIIFLGMNYAPDSDPLADLKATSKANISVYARNRDYHDVIKGKLKELAGLLVRQGDAEVKGGAEVKVFVDTAPVMEKPLAQSAGLGWQGKNTILTSREFGAWMFLGSIFTNIELPESEPHPENCGSCTACLDICPTNAFPAPFKLDARKCLAYYNNEHHGPIPQQYRKPMGNRVFGCDDCLAVCPWNKFAKVTLQSKLQAREGLVLPELVQMLSMDDGQFRAYFSGSPVKRLGHNRFLRNVLICVGNSDDQSLVDPATQRLTHSDPVVRGAAVWALSQLLEKQVFEIMCERYSVLETDSDVLAEWTGVFAP